MPAKTPMITPRVVRLLLQDELQDPDDESYYEFHNIRFADTANFVGPLLPTTIVLDVGVGQGFLAIVLRRLYGCSVNGIDVSRPEMERWKPRYSRNGIEFKYCDATSERLPFDASTFDLVLLCELIEHLPELDHLITEVRRVLKQDGSLVITTPNASRLAARVMPLMGRNPLADAPAHAREFTLRELEAELRSHGCRVEKVRFQDWWSMKAQKTRMAVRISYRLLVWAIPSMRGGILLSARKIR